MTAWPMIARCLERQWWGYSAAERGGIDYAWNHFGTGRVEGAISCPSRRIVTMIPLGDRVLVSPIVPTEKKGLIVIPETARSKPQEGTVTAVGPKVEWLKVGDHVLFGKYAGIETQIEGIPYLIVREADVMVKL